MALPQENNSITYAEYLKLDEDIQYEVIDGQIFNMSPSPSVKHQAIAMEISTEFNIYLRSKSCRVLAEIDVCLCGEKDNSKVKEWVNPDIVIVCDKNKINKNRIAGAPDLIVEILSKSTAKTDRMIKFNRYQRAGVKEYWIVDPAHETIDVYILESEFYKHDGTYANDEVIEVNIFDDLTVNLKNIFREEIDPLY
ncbi:Uma2 family endonuclease [Aquibacillus sp. 3ASR75-11]|uniref:Uma2 family endonuclease n=1 Tax=Terrihalobacillus insolitus TaxID=2950438 RepID=A0A9X3WWF6_9BACI|nr:Uma2 family endonuclease [Terrihalobacillus insolitus]MDC3426058.1 Uma2 family endonuclease [Terrihalobacillus insolitus]